eukprot:SM000093S24423  [mRNA]  locus=s93:224777:226967:- [translate_table: standard]
MSALKFLNKKGWHTGSLHNVERVWKAEQKRDAEQKKLEELQKQIVEERQAQELRTLQEQAGIVPRQERLEFLYDSGLGVGKGSSAAEEHLLGKPLADDRQGDADAAAAAAPWAVAKAGGDGPGAPPPEKKPSANDVWRKLHSDPLLLIRQQEQAALAHIRSNPVKMDVIKKQVEAEKKKRKEERRAAKVERKRLHREERSQRKKVAGSQPGDSGHSNGSSGMDSPEPSRGAGDERRQRKAGHPYNGELAGEERGRKWSEGRSVHATGRDGRSHDRAWERERETEVEGDRDRERRREKERLEDKGRARERESRMGRSREWAEKSKPEREGGRAADPNWERERERGGRGRERRADIERVRLQPGAADLGTDSRSAVTERRGHAQDEEPEARSNGTDEQEPRNGSRDGPKYGLDMARGALSQSAAPPATQGPQLKDKELAPPKLPAPAPPRVWHQVGQLSEEEKAAQLAAMREDAEVHEEQRWERLKRARERDAAEDARSTREPAARTFIDATNRAVYGAGKGGSTSIEESLKRRAHFRDRAGFDKTAFRR